MMGFSVAFQPQVLMYAFIGCIIGTLVGMMPGLGPLALNRLRHWQVDGTLLTLSTKDDAGGTVSVGKWRKAQEQP